MKDLNSIKKLNKRWDIKKDKNKPVSIVKDIPLRKQNG